MSKDLNHCITKWMSWNMNFTNSLDACALFEAELRKRKMIAEYTEALVDIARNDDLQNDDFVFLSTSAKNRVWVATATPQQRCEAWRRTVEGEK